jgi:hypothetical protein
MGLDPVCKMEVNPASADAQSEYGGQTFYFCSSDTSTRRIARRRGRTEQTPPRSSVRSFPSTC